MDISKNFPLRWGPLSLATKINNMSYTSPLASIPVIPTYMQLVQVCSRVSPRPCFDSISLKYNNLIQDILLYLFFIILANLLKQTHDFLYIYIALFTPLNGVCKCNVLHKILCFTMKIIQFVIVRSTAYPFLFSCNVFDVHCHLNTPTSSVVPDL